MYITKVHMIEKIPHDNTIAPHALSYGNHTNLAWINNLNQKPRNGDSEIT